jgi:hypothetical protein
MSHTLSQLPPSATTDISKKPSRFHAITLIGAAVAATTTFVTIAAGLPAWAMFLGWVAYSSSAKTKREGVGNLISFLVGLNFGAATSLTIGFLTPSLGGAAVPLAIFGVVIIVLSLRALPPINNPLAYILGLVSFFASGQVPSVSILAVLAVAGLIGALGAVVTNFLQSHTIHRASNGSDELGGKSNHTGRRSS